MYKFLGCFLIVFSLVICTGIAAVRVDASETDTNPIKLYIKVTDCSKDKIDGKIEVKIINYSKDNNYAISFDSGKVFYKIKGDSFTLTGARNDFYTICAMKNSDWSTVTEKYTVYVGCDCENQPVDLQIQSFGEKIYKDGQLLVSIKDYAPQKAYVLFLNNGKNTYVMNGSALNIISLNDGEYTVQVREMSAEKTRHSLVYKVTVEAAGFNQARYIKADMIFQNPELPTGCEITSLAMLLNYLGFKVDKCALADNYLEKGEYRNADPYKVFVGNPRSLRAYGCYSHAIINAAEAYLTDVGKNNDYKVYDMTGCDFENLCAAIDNDCPVIVWGTMGMKGTSKGPSWIIPETNEYYTWVGGEHCLLMTGYDKNKGIVYMNDPLKGVVTYDMNLFKKRFVQMGSHAVIIM